MTLFYGLHAAGRWGERGSNFLDGGAPFYGPYRCKDGRWLAVGALEPKFYALLREKAGLAGPEFDDQMDKSLWPRRKQRLAQLIAGRTRDEWCAVFEGSDACVSPVLDFDEAPHHPHSLARGSFVQVGGAWQPRAVPAFSATPNEIPAAPSRLGADTAQALADWDVPDAIRARLR